MTRMLEGIRILDLSRVLAGPWATQLMADLGATVIKVERPLEGDDTRRWGPPWLYAGGEATSAYYLCANRGKEAIAVDFTDAEGQQIIRDLAAGCDVVVENFKVGTLKRYGLDAARLREANPALVYCSVTGFGQDGPYSGRPGYDFIAQGMGGLMSVTGSQESGPMKTGVALSDIMTGLYSAIAILAALVRRGNTGEGAHLDVSLLDVTVATLANQAFNFFATGRIRPVMATLTPTSCHTSLSRQPTAGSISQSGTTLSFVGCATQLGGVTLLTTHALAPMVRGPETNRRWKMSWRRSL
jgi:crotonobetainyl-CoA:carnitine CoA-transferase CaiB-like acyl-CoA transferase